MTKVTVKKQVFSLKYTIESWKKLKQEHDITPVNFQTKIEDDMANTISAMIYYGLSPENREKVTVDDIDLAIDFSVVDIVSEAVMEGMPESSKEALAKAQNEEQERPELKGEEGEAGTEKK